MSYLLIYSVGSGVSLTRPQADICPPNFFYEVNECFAFGLCVAKTFCQKVSISLKPMEAGFNGFDGPKLGKGIDDPQIGDRLKKSFIIFLVCPSGHLKAPIVIQIQIFIVRFHKYSPKIKNITFIII